MTRHWQIEVETTQAHFDEAIRVVTAHQQSGTQTWANWLSIALPYGLGGLGGMALVLAIADGDLRDGVAVPPGLATLGLVGSMVAIAIFFRWTERVHARASAQHPMNERSEITINASGVSVEAFNSAMRCSWRVVDAVLEGPGVVVVQSGSSVMTIPRAAFETPADAAKAILQMREWQEAAR